MSLTTANIVICSYLGGNEELQKKRLEFHLRQRISLVSRFASSHIISICSDYPKWAKSEMRRGGWDCDFVNKRLYKLQIHNRALRNLYKDDPKEPTALLILSDDVIPTVMEDTEVYPHEMLEGWLADPTEMPASCIFFSCKGVLRDSFYKERNKKEGDFSPTQAVTGWAVMIRNDLKILMRPEEIANDSWQYNDDSMLRYRCAADGKECLKHNNLFFETFQGTSTDKNSLWYKDREQRNEGIKQTHRAIMRLWPWLLLPGSTEDRLKPVWNAKGDKLRTLIRTKCLVKGNHSYVPTPKLKKRWKEMQRVFNRPSLEDLLKEK